MNRLMPRDFTRRLLAGVAFAALALATALPAATPADAHPGPHCPAGFYPKQLGNGQWICLAGNLKAKTPTPPPGPGSFTLPAR